MGVNHNNVWIQITMQSQVLEEELEKILVTIDFITIQVMILDNNV